MENRILNWDGCKNVRDLGGLNTENGQITKFGAVVRSDTPARLTPQGWSDLYEYGIRTIITLKTHGMVEPELDFISPYPDIHIKQLDIEDVTDREFVSLYASNDLWCTPLYYQDALQRWPERHAAVISAIAKAQPGGVLFHCIRGHDRTGIISLILLGLIGVTIADRIKDYALSVDPEREEILNREKTTLPEVIKKNFDGFDVINYLCSSGVTQAEIDAVYRKLLG